MGLSETRWTGTGEINQDGYKIIFSGRQYGIHQGGVAMVLQKEAQRSLIGYDTVSPRIIKARFRTSNGATIIIQVYAPTSTTSEDDIDDFYTQLQSAVEESSNHDMMVITGDFNAKLDQIGIHGREQLKNVGMGRKITEERDCYISV